MCNIIFITIKRWDLWPYGNIHGGVDLYDGFMTGMQTIARVGDATLSNDGSIVYFESLCGITNVSIHQFYISIS